MGHSTMNVAVAGFQGSVTQTEVRRIPVLAACHAMTASGLGYTCAL